MKLLLYCTKAKPRLMISCKGEYKLEQDFKIITDKAISFNGKIVAECDFEVEEINTWKCPNIDGGYPIYNTKTLNHEKIREKSCLTDIQLEEYFGYNNGYAINLKNLHIFDKPRELDFYSSNFDYFKKVEKAPQNMMKVWEDQESPRVLISIRPEWICKILNGEKTIEIRRKVLKEML